MDALPPGLTGNLKQAICGGTGPEWLPFTGRKLYTNAFIIQDGKVLLGYKKRGFGKQKFNGFGGKVEPGETPLEAAKRELEAGITAPLSHAGMLLFVAEGAGPAFQIEIYTASTYTGTIVETDEMKPHWFTTQSDVQAHSGPGGPPQIPFDQMWDSDRHWFPLLLSAKPFVGRADFTQSGDVFSPHKWWFGVAS
ncbi:hypothetical protein BD779DRAFT_1446525 [Infundibulicybe gibba]|nr:hypothetical protein BD779DRAFT_1446525 [Infundibulicybe gibba]